jgi:hypothetical protein
MGRVDHGQAGDQTGADMERINAALQRMDLIYIEADPGDALFFNVNKPKPPQRKPAVRVYVLICTQVSGG